MTIYGISELAAAVGAERKTVAAWHARGKLPEPSVRLAMGPVWTGKAIERWIEEQLREDGWPEGTIRKVTGGKG